MMVQIHNTSELLDLLEQDYIELTSKMSKEELKEHRAKYKERGNPYQHLKTAQMDWRTEEQWSKPNDRSIVVSINDTTFGYFTFTQREPRHCTIRHIFSLPNAERGAASYMLTKWLPEYCQSIGVLNLRFFADKKAKGYYEKLYQTDMWWGLSKGGLPYYYGDLYGNRTTPPVAQHKSIKEWIIKPDNLFDPDDNMLFDW